jgi:sugar phosphate isomerase/epimerase
MNLSRREFLSALPAGAMIAARPISAAASAPRIGCQTNAWPIKPGDFPGFLAVLGELQALGFEGFETSFRNVQGQYAGAAAARARIEQAGVAFFGVHIFLTEYDPRTRVAPMDLVKATADGGAALGAQRLILSGGGLVRDGKVADDDLAQKVAGLDEAARHCRARGLAFAYHNHGPEFAAGGAEITGLIARTDPSLVSFLVDCGWAYRAGVDLAAFFTAHQARIAGLHLRDFAGEQQVPLGQGEVDWAPLASAIRASAWDGWVMAEEERADGSKPGAAAAGPARATLRKLFGR